MAILDYSQHYIVIAVLKGHTPALILTLLHPVEEIERGRNVGMGNVRGGTLEMFRVWEEELELE